MAVFITRGLDDMRGRGLLFAHNSFALAGFGGLTFVSLRLFPIHRARILNQLKGIVMLKVRNCLIAFACATLLGLTVVAIAQDATTQPAGEEQKASTHSHIVAPFNKLSDLTDDQKSKIRDIHTEILDEEKQLHQKEHDEITAVLTDDQKKELEDIEARMAAEKKAGTEERRAQSEEQKAQELKQQAEGMGTAATQPSGGQ
jgi:Spy/CpxP family protein refolding chaperone